MKKITTFLIGLTAPFYFAQQAGDLVSAEQKLDLTRRSCQFHCQ